MSENKSINRKVLPSGIVVCNYITYSRQSNWCIENTYTSHNEGAPSTIYEDGMEVWYNHGKLHRLDGPAIYSKNSESGYYVEGVKYSENDFKQKVKELEYLKLHPDMENFL